MRKAKFGNAEKLSKYWEKVQMLRKCANAQKVCKCWESIKNMRKCGKKTEWEWESMTYDATVIQS
jgi:hypothetical protein